MPKCTSYLGLCSGGIACCMDIPVDMFCNQVGNLSPMAPLSPRSALTAPLSPRSPCSPLSPFGDIGPWGSTSGRVHGYTPARNLKQSLDGLVVPTLAMPPLPKGLCAEVAPVTNYPASGINYGAPPGLSLPAQVEPKDWKDTSKDTSTPSTLPDDLQPDELSEPTSPKSEAFWL